MKRIEPLAKLIEHFKALPGIGNKTAVRLAYHVLDMEPAKARELGSDYIVVGRPITQAEDPVAAYRRCREEFVV